MRPGWGPQSPRKIEMRLECDVSSLVVIGSNDIYKTYREIYSFRSLEKQKHSSVSREGEVACILAVDKTLKIAFTASALPGIKWNSKLGVGSRCRAGAVIKLDTSSLSLFLYFSFSSSPQSFITARSVFMSLHSAGCTRTF